MEYFVIMSEIMFDELHCITVFVKRNLAIVVKHNITILIFVKQKLTIFINSNRAFCFVN